MKKYKWPMRASIIYFLFLELFGFGATHDWKIDGWLTVNIVILASFGWIVPIIMFGIAGFQE